MARLETDGGAGPAGPRSAQNESFLNTSFLQGANAAYIEGLLAAYAADPASVSSIPTSDAGSAPSVFHVAVA